MSLVSDLRPQQDKPPGFFSACARLSPDRYVHIFLGATGPDHCERLCGPGQQHFCRRQLTTYVPTSICTAFNVFLRDRTNSFRRTDKVCVIDNRLQDSKKYE